MPKLFKTIKTLQVLKRFNRRRHSLDEDESEEDEEFNISKETIQILANSHQLVQKRAFTKWINFQLSNTDKQITDFDNDLRDGILLEMLIEKLFDSKLKTENKLKITKIHNLERVSRCISFLKNFQPINIDSSSIVEGNIKLTLGLVWIIITKHNSLKLTNIGVFKQESDKLALMKMITNSLRNYQGLIKMPKDFSTNWKDGVLFSAVIHSVDPALISNFGNIIEKAMHSTESWKHILNNAFHIASKEFNAPMIIEPRDLLNVAIPDEKIIITYLMELYLSIETKRKNKSDNTTDNMYVEIVEFMNSVNNNLEKFELNMLKLDDLMGKENCFYVDYISTKEEEFVELAETHLINYTNFKNYQPTIDKSMSVQPQNEFSELQKETINNLKLKIKNEWVFLNKGINNEELLLNEFENWKSVAKNIYSLKEKAKKSDYEMQQIIQNSLSQNKNETVNDINSLTNKYLDEWHAVNSSCLHKMPTYIQKEFEELFSFIKAIQWNIYHYKSYSKLKSLQQKFDEIHLYFFKNLHKTKNTLTHSLWTESIDLVSAQDQYKEIKDWFNISGKKTYNELTSMCDKINEIQKNDAILEKNSKSGALNIDINTCLHQLLNKKKEIYVIWLEIEKTDNNIQQALTQSERTIEAIKDLNSLIIQTKTDTNSYTKESLRQLTEKYELKIKNSEKSHHLLIIENNNLFIETNNRIKEALERERLKLKLKLKNLVEKIELYSKVIEKINLIKNSTKELEDTTNEVLLKIELILDTNNDIDSINNILPQLIENEKMVEPIMDKLYIETQEIEQFDDHDILESYLVEEIETTKSNSTKAQQNAKKCILETMNILKEIDSVTMDFNKLKKAQKNIIKFQDICSQEIKAMTTSKRSIMYHDCSNFIGKCFLLLKNIKDNPILISEERFIQLSLKITELKLDVESKSNALNNMFDELKSLSLKKEADYLQMYSTNLLQKNEYLFTKITNNLNLQINSGQLNSEIYSKEGVDKLEPKYEFFEAFWKSDDIDVKQSIENYTKATKVHQELVLLFQNSNKIHSYIKVLKEMKTFYQKIKTDVGDLSFEENNIHNMHQLDLILDDLNSKINEYIDYINEKYPKTDLIGIDKSYLLKIESQDWVVSKKEILEFLNNQSKEFNIKHKTIITKNTNYIKELIKNLDLKTNALTKFKFTKEGNEYKINEILMYFNKNIDQTQKNLKRLDISIEKIHFKMENWPCESYKKSELESCVENSKSELHTLTQSKEHLKYFSDLEHEILKETRNINEFIEKNIEYPHKFESFDFSMINNLSITLQSKDFKSNVDKTKSLLSTYIEPSNIFNTQIEQLIKKTHNSKENENVFKSYVLKNNELETLSLKTSVLEQKILNSIDQNSSNDPNIEQGIIDELIDEYKQITLKAYEYYDMEFSNEKIDLFFQSRVLKLEEKISSIEKEFENSINVLQEKKRTNMLENAVLDLNKDLDEWRVTLNEVEIVANSDTSFFSDLETVKNKADFQLIKHKKICESKFFKMKDLINENSSSHQKDLVKQTESRLNSLINNTQKIAQKLEKRLRYKQDEIDNINMKLETRKSILNKNLQHSKSYKPPKNVQPKYMEFYSNKAQTTKSNKENRPYTSLSNRKTSTSPTIQKKVNNYIPDNKDKLDIEISKIINSFPKSVNIKKDINTTTASTTTNNNKIAKYIIYSNANKEPKSYLCRILLSNLVMVRIGGGWIELSQFLQEKSLELTNENLLESD